VAANTSDISGYGELFIVVISSTVFDLFAISRGVFFSTLRKFVVSVGVVDSHTIGGFIQTLFTV